MKAKLLLTMALLALGAMPVRAEEEQPATYKWTVATDAVQWALLGCINASVEYCPGENWGFMAAMRYNPFTYLRGTEKQTQLRQATPVLGVKYWVDAPYEGWFMDGRVLASVYSVSNVFNSGCFDGQAIAAGIGAGWCRVLDERWRLSLGAGVLAALHDTTFYMGPVCGRISGHKRGPSLLPDLSVSINYLF
ncbi:MAG: DUF3575 domain-containing protein [Bacteroidales bacterium]|nr:DUF3575 domain-containing protein [Bacteroidales bacterium]